MSGGRGAQGDGEQSRADWQELAATGCCPSGAEARPRLGVESKGRPRRPGLADLAASEPVTVREKSGGEKSTPAASLACSPRGVGAAR